MSYLIETYRDGALVARSHFYGTREQGIEIAESSATVDGIDFIRVIDVEHSIAGDEIWAKGDPGNRPKSPVVSQSTRPCYKPSGSVTSRDGMDD